MGVSTPSDTISAAAAVAMSWKKRHSFGRAASLPVPRAQPRQSSHRLDSFVPHVTAKFPASQRSPVLLMFWRSANVPPSPWNDPVNITGRHREGNDTRRTTHRRSSINNHCALMQMYLMVTTDVSSHTMLHRLCEAIRRQRSGPCAASTAAAKNAPALDILRFRHHRVPVIVLEHARQRVEGRLRREGVSKRTKTTSDERRETSDSACHRRAAPASLPTTVSAPSLRADATSVRGKERQRKGVRTSVARLSWPPAATRCQPLSPMSPNTTARRRDRRVRRVAWEGGATSKTRCRHNQKRGAGPAAPRPRRAAPRREGGRGGAGARGHGWVCGLQRARFGHSWRVPTHAAHLPGRPAPAAASLWCSSAGGWSCTACELRRPSRVSAGRPHRPTCRGTHPSLVAVRLVWLNARYNSTMRGTIFKTLDVVVVVGEVVRVATR